MKTDATTLAAFQEFCRRMASRLQVWGYECWNEPNLHLTLYPQSTAERQGLRRPRVSSRCCSSSRSGIACAAIHSSRAHGRRARRLGAIRRRLPLASRRMMTSPQRFAGQIKAHSVSSLFDAYSHHPYTPGASSQELARGAAARRPRPP